MTTAVMSVPVPGEDDLTQFTRRIETADVHLKIDHRRLAGDAPLPALLFFHRGPGLDDGSKQAMNILARAGYAVFAPDRYYRAGAWLLSIQPLLFPVATSMRDSRLFS